MTFPTGVPAESASQPLAANTNRPGSMARSGGAWRWSGPSSITLVVNGTALFTQSFVRHVGAVEEQLGTQFSGLFAAGWIFRNEAAIAATFTYSDTLDARINGVAVPSSEIQINTLGSGRGLLTDEQLAGDRLLGSGALEP